MKNERIEIVKENSDGDVIQRYKGTLFIPDERNLDYARNIEVIRALCHSDLFGDRPSRIPFYLIRTEGIADTVFIRKLPLGYNAYHVDNSSCSKGESVYGLTEKRIDRKAKGLALKIAKAISEKTSRPITDNTTGSVKKI